MANSEHLEWLLEGPEEWNDRRKRLEFKPDLADVDIYGECLKKGLVNEKGLPALCDINLNGADLSGARFCHPYTADGGDFTGSTFWHANLRNANLANSCFERGVFNGARLVACGQMGVLAVDVCNINSMRCNINCLVCRA